MKDSNPIGRPTKMDETTVNKLKEAFALGCTDEEACYYAEISKQTLYNYQDNHPDFLDQKQRLKERPVFLARKTVVDGVQSDKDLALKFLERKKKDEFSLKQETDNTVHGEISVTFKRKDGDQH